MSKLKNFDVIGKSRIFFLIPAIIIIAGIIVSLILGLNIGIDFEGGTSINVSYNRDLNDADYAKELARIREVITKEGLKIAQEQKAEDNGTVIRIIYENIEGADMNEYETKVRTALNALYTDADDVNVNVSDSKSSAASQRLLLSATIAIVAASVVMLIYIGFRFDWKSGLAAIIALIINVLIMVALTAIFQIQINTSFIAAVITIIAYSINATIVIFDRVRENKKKAIHNEKISEKDIANNAIRSSFTRTIWSTFTTLVTITVLAIIALVNGLSSIYEFAFPIIFGLIAGSFSSVCIAPALWVLFSGGRLVDKKVVSEK